MTRLTRRAVKGHGRLALVRNAERHDTVLECRNSRRHFAQCGHRELGNFVGIVLDPTGLGEVLGQLSIGRVDFGAVGAEGHCAYPSGASVECQDEVHASTLPKRRHLIEVH